MQSLWELRRRPLSLVLRLLTYGAALATLAVILMILGFILIRGIPNLTPSLFAWEYTPENGSMTPALINTVIMTLLTLLIAIPLGIFAAIYLTEYTRRGNRLVTITRLAAETLAGIPSIIYGLFGMLLFVFYFQWGYSLLAGACTLAIMILPLIIRTTEEAILSVPDTYREASFGLGAGRLRTVFVIVLPSAIPGILAGVILAIGRIVGETAALIFTASTLPQLPTNLFSSTRTMSVLMYALATEGLYIEQAYATAAVLLGLVIVINLFSKWLASRITKKNS